MGWPNLWNRGFESAGRLPQRHCQWPVCRNTKSAKKSRRAHLRRTGAYLWQTEQHSTDQNDVTGTENTITAPHIAPTPHHHRPSTTALTTSRTDTLPRSQPSTGHTLSDSLNRKWASLKTITSRCSTNHTSSDSVMTGTQGDEEVEYGEDVVIGEFINTARDYAWVHKRATV